MTSERVKSARDCFAEMERKTGTITKMKAYIVYHPTVETDYDVNWFRGAETVASLKYSDIAKQVAELLNIPSDQDAVIEAGSTKLLIAFYPKGGKTISKTEEWEQ